MQDKIDDCDIEENCIDDIITTNTMPKKAGILRERERA